MLPPLLVSLIFTVRRDHFLYLLYVSLSPHSPVSSYRATALRIFWSTEVTVFKAKITADICGDPQYNMKNCDSIEGFPI